MSNLNVSIIKLDTLWYLALVSDKENGNLFISEMSSETNRTAQWTVSALSIDLGWFMRTLSSAERGIFVARYCCKFWQEQYDN